MIWECVEESVAKVRPTKGLVCINTRVFSIEMSLPRVTTRGIKVLS